VTGAETSAAKPAESKLTVKLIPKGGDRSELEDDKILQLRVTGVDECALGEAEEIFRPYHRQGKGERSKPEVALSHQSAVEGHREGELAAMRSCVIDCHFFQM
jgi:hypothetical protein